MEAARVIDQRGNLYGEMVENHERAARLFNDMVADVQLQAHHIAAVLMAVKLMRIYANPALADSFVDLASYAAFRAELVGTDQGVPASLSAVVTRNPRAEALGRNALNDLLNADH